MTGVPPHTGGTPNQEQPFRCRPAMHLTCNTHFSPTHLASLLQQGLQLLRWAQRGRSGHSAARLLWRAPAARRLGRVHNPATTGGGPC